MGLATVEIRRASLRFGLLTGAVALLVFLILLLTTLSNSLVSSLVGALEGLRADGIVYAVTAQDNIAGSRMEPSVVSDVAALPGVVDASAVGTLTANGTVAGTDTELQVFGFTVGRPGEPTALTDGRLPETDGETAVDGGGAQIGDVVEVGGVALRVVGLLRGAQFNALPTAYVTLTDYDQIVTALNPGLPFVPINAVAFTVGPDVEVADIADAVTGAVPGVIGYTLADAVSLIPGIESIGQSFGILVGLTFIIGIVVIGFFFLILTVQKMRTFTLLRAVGASTGRLASAVAVQIVAVVIAASALALGLTSLALRGIQTGIPVSLNASTVITTIIAVLAFSLLAGLLSIRRIARIDPASAVGAR